MTTWVSFNLKSHGRRRKTFVTFCWLDRNSLNVYFSFWTEKLRDEDSRRPVKPKEPRKRGNVKRARILQKGKNAPFDLQKTAEKLQGRSQEVSEANIDIFKLLSSLNLSMLLMDRELRIRRVINEIPSPLAVPDIKAHIIEVMQSLKPMLVEVRGPDARRYELQIRPYFGAGKRLEGAVIAVADITELTKRTADLAASQESLRGEQIKRAGAEEFARAGEVRFRTVADSLPELIAFVDAEQRYQFCNKSYEKSLGVSPNDFIGRTVREVLGEAVYATFKPFIQKALAGQYASYEGYVSHEKFGRRYLHIDYIPHRDEHGKVDGFYSVIRNLTELKEAEEKFRALVETSPQAIIIHDAKGKIVIVNAEAEHIFGYRRQELIGQPVEILMPARFRAKHVERAAGLHAEADYSPNGCRIGTQCAAQRRLGVSSGNQFEPGGNCARRPCFQYDC